MAPLHICEPHAWFFSGHTECCYPNSEYLSNWVHLPVFIIPWIFTDNCCNGWGLCVWRSTCSCLSGVCFLSAPRPPSFSQALLRGPKITSHSMLPGLWNNNTPGFPITAAQANGDWPENMCRQTRALRWGGGRAGRGSKEMAKVRSAGTRHAAETSH